MTTTAPLTAPADLPEETADRARAAVAGMAAAQAAESRATAVRLRWVVQLHAAVREARFAQAHAEFAALEQPNTGGTTAGASGPVGRRRSRELLDSLTRHRLVLETAAEVGLALRLPTGTEVQTVADALVLAEDLPAVLDALEEGTITWPHARAVLQQWQQLVEEDPGDADPQCSSADGPPVPQALQLAHEMLERAPYVTVAQLRSFAHRCRARLLADAQERRRRGARKHRAVWTELADDGLAWVHALLDAPVARAVADRLERLADAVRGAEPGVVPDGLQVLPGTGPEERERRSPGEIRADVLTDLLLDGELPEGSGLPRGIRGQVCVTVPLADLTDPAAGSGRRDVPGAGSCCAGPLPAQQEPCCAGLRRSDDAGPGVARHVGARGVPAGGAAGPPAELEGYGPISAEVARQVAAGAGAWHRLLTHPVTGVVLHHDRTVYAVPAGLRRHLRLRDDTCRFPGCRRSASTADVDHTVAWEDGGRTDAENLAHLCRHHHLVKHRGGPLGRWSVRRVRPPGTGPDPGVLEWRSPSGALRRTVPETAGPGATRWLTPEGPPGPPGTSGPPDPSKPRGLAEDPAPEGAPTRVVRWATLPGETDDPPPF